MKKILLIALTVVVALQAHGAYPVHHGFEYRVSAGFNIGASAPMGIPAEIRKIDSYNPTLNLSVGVEGLRMLAPKWGVGLGVALETKGMKTGIEAKNYHLTMNIVQGDATGVKTGYYTGKIKNTTKVSYLTVPVFAVFRPSDNWDFTGGVYFSYAIDRSFLGAVWSGKMREDPLHPAIGIDKAEYDYSSDIRKFDTGVTVGAARRIYRNLGIRANLQWGVLSTLKASTRKIDMDTYNIYLNLALTFAL